MYSPKPPQFEVRYPDGKQPVEFEGRMFSDLSRLMKLLKEYNMQRKDNNFQPLDDSMIRVVREQPRASDH